MFNRGIKKIHKPIRLIEPILIIETQEYCVVNFQNEYIIRPVQRQFEEHYRCKYCLYYKYCLNFNASIGLAGAVLRAYLILNIYFSYYLEIF